MEGGKPENPEKNPRSKARTSLFQALGQWERSKKRAGDKRDQLRAGSGREKERASPPFSTRPRSSPARFFNRPHWQRAWNRLCMSAYIRLQSKNIHKDIFSIKSAEIKKNVYPYKKRGGIIHLALIGRLGLVIWGILLTSPGTSLILSYQDKVA